MLLCSSIFLVLVHPVLFCGLPLFLLFRNIVPISVRLVFRSFSILLVLSFWFPHLYDVCLFDLAFPWLFGFLVSFLRTSATSNCLSYAVNVCVSFLSNIARARAIASLTDSVWLLGPPPITRTFMSTFFDVSPAINSGSCIFSL